MRFLFFLLLFQTSLLIAAPIEVSVDRDIIKLNESFEITFSSNEDPDANPDFSPLEKDFEILNENHGSTMSWINGQSTREIHWIFTVIAKKAGKLQIPTLSFGSDSSPAITVNVTENTSIAPKSYNINAPIFLEVEATPKNPYLQSQVIYTLRFFRRVNIVEARLTEPELADAVVEKLGKDKNYRTERGGMVYEVTERRYAIFPQKSGKMIIEPLKLTAAVLMDNGSRMGGFFGTQATKRERVVSEAVTLNVRPIPKTFTGDQWLVAKNVKLSQQWSGDYQAMQVGEPLTRTLTLTVDGATLGQLPQLQKSSKEKYLKNYPDQPSLKETKTKTGLIAIREEKIAFIPSKAGNYILPEITLDWFNIETEKMETVTLPETIVIAQGGVTTSTPKLKVKPVQSSVSTTSTPINNNRPSENNIRLWQGLSLLLASAWLITLFLFFNKKSPPVVIKTNDNVVNSKATIKVLKQACKANDAQAAKQALMAWGQLQYATANLGALANHCEARLRDEILILNQNLYSQHPNEWHGQSLFQFFSEHNARTKIDSKISDDALEPLYRI